MPSDITICGHIYYDIIYLLTKFPKEKDDIRNPIVKKQFGGAFNTIKALRRINKKLKINVMSILGKDHIGNEAIRELKKLKIQTNDIVRSRQTNDDFIIINQKNNSKTVFPRTFHNKINKIPNLKNTKWIHFMYLDNTEFLDIYSDVIINKNNNQIFSADISNKKFKKTNIKKYLPFIDYLIFSTKELNSILGGSNYKNFTPTVIKKLRDLNKIVPNIIVHSKSKSMFFYNQNFIVYDYRIKTNEKLNILGAGDNFAACILNEIISNKTISTQSLEKAHKFATAYCLANKNI